MPDKCTEKKHQLTMLMKQNNTVSHPASPLPQDDQSGTRRGQKIQLPQRCPHGQTNGVQQTLLMDHLSLTQLLNFPVSTYLVIYDAQWTVSGRLRPMCSKPHPLATVYRCFLLLRCSTTDDDAHHRRLPCDKVSWWSPSSTSSWRQWCCLARHGKAYDKERKNKTKTSELP